MAKNWKNSIPWENHDWAKFATLDKNGTLKLWRDKPIAIDAKGFWWMRYGPQHYLGSDCTLGEQDRMMSKIQWTAHDTFEYKGDWKNAIVEKEKK